MDFSFPTFRSLASLEWPPKISWWPWYTTKAQSRALLRLIAVSLEENLPLGPLVESWAQDERGIQKQRLLRLVRLLGGGMPLADAIEQTAGVLRDEDLLAIRFDAQSGTRTAAIRALLDDAQPSLTARPSGVRDWFVYCCIILPICLLLVVFMQIKTVPAISKILLDYSLPEPPALLLSKQTSAVAASYWWLIALAMVAVLWSVFSTRGGRFVRRTILGRLFNPWHELYAADVLRKLGLATGDGRPLAGVLSTLARYHYEPAIRHKLLFVRNEVEHGADVWQSMTAVGLLTGPEEHLLETAERVGNRPWALHELASGKRRRTTRRWESLTMFLLPALVIALGVFVLWQALSLFLPLIQILQAI